MTNLEEYYNKFNEEKRLNSRHGQVEFVTSMKYIHKYIDVLEKECEPKILDIGAETGHLVVSTLHTNNAVQTVSRIVNFFEPAERGYIRQQVANTLRGTIAQKLVPTVDEDSRLPAPEILVVTPTAVDFIGKEELDQIYQLVRQGSYDNMTTMNMSLYKLYEDGKITQETALYYSDAKQELEKMMRGVYHGTGVNRKY